MTQVLARKWRPKTFSEMVGQEHVVRALTNGLRQQRLHHAYLFTGTRGVGKTTLARIMAKALNCEGGISAEPCGVCGACREIDAGRYVDLIELDAASNTQVDNMRELLENALYAPSSGRFKVYIIDEVHMLSRNAFNAMLKTLEEPPQHVKFILATTEPQKVPVTVLSRCLQFNLKLIPPAQIAARLEQVLQAEGVDFDPPALARVARVAQGSLRDSLSLLDQAIAHGGGRVAEEAVRAMLGSVDQSCLYAILRAIAARDGGAVMAEVERLASHSLSFESALQELGVVLHRAALLQMVPQAVAADDPDRPELETVAALFGPEELQLFYQIAAQGRSDLPLAPDEYAGFTMTLLRMLAFAPQDAPAPGAAPRAAGRTPAAPGTAKAEGAPWTEVIEGLGLTGMARMLAQHCEVVHRDAQRMELRLGAEHEQLLDKPFADKLKAALRERLGAGVRVTITVGPASGNSPAAAADRERQQRHERAIKEIEDDPFVRDLVENFEARVVESTIKPLQ
jgi:DNA polymerase III subunit gamma/tau